jgi:hypothetical protein
LDPGVKRFLWVGEFESTGQRISGTKAPFRRPGRLPGAHRLEKRPNQDREQGQHNGGSREDQEAVGWAEPVDDSSDDEGDGKEWSQVLGGRDQPGPPNSPADCP